MRRTALAGVALGAVAVGCHAQECGAGGRVLVQVLDATGAEIVGAAVNVDGGKPTLSDAHGRFTSECVSSGVHRVHVEATGFNPSEVRAETGRSISVKLRPMTVETTVEAAHNSDVSTENVGGTQTLEPKEINQLADDPDEFARQLQVLAVASGGAPGQATIAVDGFQNSGRIPPKSSIAYIRVNPDLYAAEYERAPYQGGRVEIYTKPGLAKYHGALFTTQSAQWMNAKDPFAPSKAAIGRQRYGFEVSGPIKAAKQDFALALEHREIDQFAVVNAVVLDSNGNPTQFNANVPATQSLWQASARLGMLVTPKNNFTATYTATANGLLNVGAGGTVLEEASYDSQQNEHAVRITNLQTISAAMLHESRVGITLRTRDDSPHATTPSLQVAGAFTGGGAVTQQLRSHEFDLEVDDDVLFQHGKHNLKAGVELLNVHLDDRLPTNHNGTYIFGGGIAPVLDASSGVPGNTETISGLEQYRRALKGLPGGNPTQFAVTSGDTTLRLNQLRVAPYVQDLWKARPRLEVSLGLRWAMQSAPETIGNIAPRIGVAWSPDHKSKWIIHVRTGLFYSPVDSQTTLEAKRLDGIHQALLQISDPVYGLPDSTGTARVTTLRAPLPNLTQTPSLQTHLGLEHDFPKHWHAQANLYLADAWSALRSRNINAPLNNEPGGPRPGLPDLNVYQFQQSGNLRGNVFFGGVDQRAMKNLQLFAGYLHFNIKTDADSDAFFPQNSRNDAGEYARWSMMATHRVITFANYVLPFGVPLTIQFDAASGLPYNVTTGFDSNGDGIFNDRPRFANNGDQGAIATPFGVLSNAGSGGYIHRNAGTLPWNVHFDANLSRSFKLPGREGQSLGVNLRSTNLLNHTNGTAVGGVLGSPLFGRTYAADSGRRIEAGLRYSF